MTDKRTCPNCKGTGGGEETVRRTGSGVGRTVRTRRWTCRYCQGTGSIEVDTRPTHEILAELHAADLAEHGPAEIPDWML